MYKTLFAHEKNAAGGSIYSWWEEVYLVRANLPNFTSIIITMVHLEKFEMFLFVTVLCHLFRYERVFSVSIKT